MPQASPPAWATTPPGGSEEAGRPKGCQAVRMRPREQAEPRPLLGSLLHCLCSDVSSMAAVGDPPQPRPR